VVLRWGITAVGKHWKIYYSRNHREIIIPFGPPKSLAHALQCEKMKKKNKQAYVTAEEGQQLAQKLGAHGYYEISSISLIGVKEMFMEAVRAAVQPAEKPKKKWYQKLLKLKK